MAFVIEHENIIIILYFADVDGRVDLYRITSAVRGEDDAGGSVDEPRIEVIIDIFC